MEDVAPGFDEFVRRRHPALVRSAFLLLGDRGAAEDLVQSALFRAFCAWDRIAAEPAAESYVRTTMVRLAGRWSRRRWRGEIPVPELPDRSTPTDDRSPEHQIAATDVQQALARLPWPQRTVLVLRFFDDLTEARTAEVLGCSVGTVKSRASRGLAALRADGLLRTTTVDEEMRRG